MLFCLIIAAGCGPLSVAPSAFGRPREERCLRHREFDGHATPKWVLQSAAG
jgi:hypothetical protein